MENWKDIKEFEGYYQVSDMGRVRSVDRMVWNGRNYYLVKGSIKIPTTTKDGYLQVKLNKDGIHKMMLVHRLVAEAFIPNPENKPCINHKSERKNENTVDNLEWCTVSYNNSYNGRNDRVSRTMKERYSRLFV